LSQSDAIRLSQVERHFQRGSMAVEALRGIDLTVVPGEFVALVGPSGSGKSTLLNLLGGLDRPSGGELWLDGLPLHSASADERTRHRRQRVGFIFQSFNLLPRLTTLENVAIPLMLNGVGRGERLQRAADMLERVGLAHRLDHYPSELSGGEQQRTAIARALIHDPSLILADEPTGNLDSATGNEVMDLLRRLNAEQGITLIVVTHDPEVAAYAGRTVSLRDGSVVDGGGPSLHGKPQVGASSEDNGGSLSNRRPFNSTRSKGLTKRDNLRSAFMNLGRRPVRNILTAGGVLIGIVTLVAMVSFGVGVQREVQRNFETIGLENVIVRPSFEENDDLEPFASPKPLTPITPDLVRQIRGMEGVNAVLPSLRLPSGLDVSLEFNESDTPVRLFSSSGEMQFGPPGVTSLMAGRDFDENETSGAVLIKGLADTLLQDGERYEQLIGRQAILTVRLPRGETSDYPVTIIGVRDGFGSRSMDVGLDERVEIKEWWFGETDILQSEGYDMLTVRATELSTVPLVIESIELLDLQTQSLESVLDVATQVLSLLQALLGSVGGLALLVAALGVANTMMMAIYERTREIGVLKALGASAREIRWLFTVEAALIGFLGGAFGLLFGILLGRLVDWIAHRYLINEGVTGVGQLSVVPLWLGLGALAFAALIGVLAGLYPAARAAKLDPIAALRHE
jgi:ABC-type lipoprotein export system ATPase subunit/ABC-type antimicrobial peptide transport system permease subunit